ncbi:MAG: hypothetical protein KJ607_03605 [Bacteroidetes bacterium]|nr:hypothetical protein [Bacteroidota bacterium]
MKGIILGTGILILFAIAGSIYIYNLNRNLKKALDSEKLRAERLYSENLSKDKQVAGFEKDNAALKSKFKYLNQLLSDNEKDLSKKEAEIRRLRNLNVAPYERKIAKSEKDRKTLEEQIVQLNQFIDRLKAEKDEIAQALESQKNTNSALTENLNILSAILANNFMLEATKGGRKDKLTVNARRTRKIMASFDLPESIAASVSFRITTPDGKIYNSTESLISVRIEENPGSLTACLSPFTGTVETTKRVEVAYKPKGKPLKGIYKIDVYSNENYLGSSQLKLR